MTSHTPAGRSRTAQFVYNGITNGGGLQAFKEHSVPGKTEIEVVAAVEHAITVHGHGYKGARWVRGFLLWCAGLV